MLRGKSSVMRGLLLVVMVVALAGCASTKMKRENAELKSQVGQLQESLANSEADATRLQGENSSLQTELDRTKSDYAAKNAELEAMAGKLRAGGFDVSVRDGMVIVTMAQSVLFDSGSAAISSRGSAKLTELSKALNGDFKGYTVEVSGHTDTDPIVRTRDKYKSNWELSYDRAQTVAYNLMNVGKVDPKRVRVVANSQYRPVASNSSADGKAKNRRVEILVIRPAGQ